jgi:hypothetical protein
MKIGAVNSYETPVNTRTTWRYISEHRYRCDLRPNVRAATVTAEMLEVLWSLRVTAERSGIADCGDTGAWHKRVSTGTDRLMDGWTQLSMK